MWIRCQRLWHWDRCYLWCKLNLYANAHNYRGCTGFEYYNFTGAKWNNVRKEDNVLYLKNAYRVLLTRARQGFIIFIPTGDRNDKTMLPDYYDGVYNYLKDIGIEEVLF